MSTKIKARISYKIMRASKIFEPGCLGSCTEEQRNCTVERKFLFAVMVSENNGFLNFDT
jgi:hypothetical protein